jgi:putative hydrolase of the HAD superfamily
MFKQPLGMSPKAVVFDLDDTLYPEQQYAYSGFQAVAKYVKKIYGLDIYEELVKCHRQGERTNVFGATLAKFFTQVEEPILRKIVHIYWAHTPRLTLFEDARICMALLFSRGIKVSLITTGLSAIQRKKVTALELEPLLDGIIYTDDLIGTPEPGQPCEDAFHILSLQLDTELNEMVYVGDNPLTDFAVPRRLGIKTVRIKRSGGEFANENPPTLGYQADRVITSLVDLPGLFYAISNRIEKF